MALVTFERIASSIYILCSFVLLHFEMSTSSTVGAPSASATRNLFAADLYQQIAKKHSEENIVFSPVSIQACLVLGFIGAEGETASELRKGLHLGVADKEMVVQTFGGFIRKELSDKGTEANEKGPKPKLKMANRVYLNANAGEIAPNFARIASEHFDTKAERLPFAEDAAGAVHKINTWVEEQTENKITNLLQPEAVNSDTSALLVNAIYFKGKWRTPFSLESTNKMDFITNGNQRIKVDVMSMEDKFQYAKLPELDATALELPYANSDLSMLIILPNKADGLHNVEQKLANLQLQDIVARMRFEDVLVMLPKFRIELDLDLKQILQKLGMSQMFGEKANFSGLFTSSQPRQRVSDVRHKAYLDVNEAGSEAAAATFLKIVPMSLNLEQKRFNADHPFIFAIRNDAAIYFVGHVTRP